jgi:hypothetical protein
MRRVPDCDSRRIPDNHGFEAASIFGRGASLNIADAPNVKVVPSKTFRPVKANILILRAARKKPKDAAA